MQRIANPYYGGANPSLNSKVYSILAQLVEPLTVNQVVAGSSPADGAISLLCLTVE